MTLSKAAKAIRDTLTAGDAVNGIVPILQIVEGRQVGRLVPISTPYGRAYEVELAGEVVTAQRSIPNGLDAAAIHLNLAAVQAAAERALEAAAERALVETQALLDAYGAEDAA